MMREDPPLDFQDDIWLLRNRQAARLGMQWFIELEGFMPYQGCWAQLAPAHQKNNDEELWVWLATGSLEKGGWIFRGQQPQYNETLGIWLFVSSCPELKYESEGVIVCRKMRIDNEDRLRIARDSVHALKNIERRPPKPSSLREVISQGKQRREARGTTGRSSIETPGRTGKLGFLIALSNQVSCAQGVESIVGWILSKIQDELGCKTVFLFEAQSGSRNLKVLMSVGEWTEAEFTWEAHQEAIANPNSTQFTNPIHPTLWVWGLGRNEQEGPLQTNQKELLEEAQKHLKSLAVQLQPMAA